MGTKEAKDKSGIGKRNRLVLGHETSQPSQANPTVYEPIIPTTAASIPIFSSKLKKSFEPLLVFVSLLTLDCVLICSYIFFTSQSESSV